MKRGDKVLITFCGQVKQSRILLASENQRSLALAFDGAFRDGEGGMYVGMMSVLQDDDGTYRDLIGNRPVEIEPARSAS